MDRKAQVTRILALAALSLLVLTAYAQQGIPIGGERPIRRAYPGKALFVIPEDSPCIITRFDKDRQLYTLDCSPKPELVQAIKDRNRRGQ